jgi:sarcosine/dimethylglycine N-methyltransferase
MTGNQYSEVVETARQYYNSEDADNFYFHVWGGEDIHVGIYDSDDEDIATASKRTVRRMAEMVNGLGSSSRVIDLGSGYGGSARYLAREYGCHVTALNLSEAENDRNRALSAQQGLASRISVVDGSFEDIPAGDASFDLVWSQDAILHSGHRMKVIQETVRVLKPGGELIFTDPMQADDCPAGVLQPVLDRIHLDSLGSFAFYNKVAADSGLEQLEQTDLTPHLVRHYRRVRQELQSQRAVLADRVSDDYIERMLKGLENWINAGEKGFLAWGILHFRKPA